MRQAIISDIHGNLEALEQVLERIEGEHVDQIVCLGDVVGYGPFPDECLQRLSSLADIKILGNHDDAVLGRTDITDFNEHARTAVRWTREILSQQGREELMTFVPHFSSEIAHYVHATPLSPMEWDYILNVFDAERNFTAFTQRVCFIGHTHVAYCFESTPEEFIRMRRASGFTLSNHTRYIINVGSVGQPRDGNPAAAFVIFDDENGAVEFVRVPYDVKKTQLAMQKAGLPEFLIKRLQLGH
ncbi:metallophosphoesterase family protein [candidate division KSB1 bacterium]|nr:metallophosphoesterase family protein [candidate division KSB1 bacterium]